MHRLLHDNPQWSSTPNDCKRNRSTLPFHRHRRAELGAVRLPWFIGLFLALSLVTWVPQTNAQELLSHESTVEGMSLGLNQPATLVVDQDAPTDSLERPTPNQAITSATINADEQLDVPSDPFLRQIAAEAQQFSGQKWGGSAIQTALLLGALSLAPAILLMTTCYVRIIVVLSLLRQAIGAQQLPPTQVLTALSIFLTLMVMGPIWMEVKSAAIDPYQAENSTMGWEEAWQRGVVPIKRFMLKQIEITQNREALQVFYQRAVNTHSPGQSGPTLPEDLEQVPIHVVLPAFLMSELKVAFLLGFQIFLPFLVVDLVVSTVTVSMGMVMLPPAMVSLPLKLILFVMVDGWNLVVGMLLQSFGPISGWV